MHTNVLQSIHEGMTVVDAANDEIGTVEFVKLVDTDPVTGEPVAADGDDPEARNPTLMDTIAEAFGADEVPDVVRERLLQSGFIRMDADGLFASDRYVLPEQIAGVMGGRVQLNVKMSDLQKAH